MKFELHDYWKHKDCLDVFIFCSSVIQDTGEVAILQAHWFTQGVENYWMCTQLDRLFIKRKEYANWKRYEPKGKWLYS